jgi:hypothetical protein
MLFTNDSLYSLLVRCRACQILPNRRFLGYWWAKGTDLLVQIAGPECSRMVVLNTGTGETISEFPIPLKGDVRLSADRTWVAVESKDRATSTP